MQKEIVNNEVAPERVGRVLEINFGGSSGTEIVWKQCFDLKDYTGGLPKDRNQNAVHQRLIEIMHAEAKGDIPTVRCRDITLMTKYVNEVNEVLKCARVLILLFMLHYFRLWAAFKF